MSADIVTRLSHQLLHARWSFQPAITESGDDTGLGGSAATGRWLVDEESSQLATTAPDDARTFRVRVSARAFVPDDLVTSRHDVLFETTNPSREDHELLVVQLSGDASVEDLLRDSSSGFPTGVTFIGQATVPAGDTASLVLVDLPTGSYAIVDLLPNSEGTPHLALGMKATLTIR